MVLFHHSDQIDQTNEIIPIYRENKINFLNYIYKTEDNYIIASSDKKLIKNSISSSKNFKKKKISIWGRTCWTEQWKKYIIHK